MPLAWLCLLAYPLAELLQVPDYHGRGLNDNKEEVILIKDVGVL